MAKPSTTAKYDAAFFTKQAGILLKMAKEIVVDRTLTGVLIGLLLGGPLAYAFSNSIAYYQMEPPVRGAILFVLLGFIPALLGLSGYRRGTREAARLRFLVHWGLSSMEIEQSSKQIASTSVPQALLSSEYTGEPKL